MFAPTSTNPLPYQKTGTRFNSAATSSNIPSSFGSFPSSNKPQSSSSNTSSSFKYSNGFSSGSPKRESETQRPFSFGKSNSPSTTALHEPSSPQSRYVPPFLLNSLGATTPSKDYNVGSPKSSDLSNSWTPTSHIRTRTKTPPPASLYGNGRHYSTDEYGGEYGSPSRPSVLMDDLPPIASLSDLSTAPNNKTPPTSMPWGNPSYGTTFPKRIDQKPDLQLNGNAGGGLFSKTNNYSDTNNTTTSTFPQKSSFSFQSTDNTKQSTTVTIIGFPPNESEFIASHFKSFGDVKSISSPDGGNWMSITYMNNQGAQSALTQHRKIFKQKWMLTVELDTSPSSASSSSASQFKFSSEPEPLGSSYFDNAKESNGLGSTSSHGFGNKSNGIGIRRSESEKMRKKDESNDEVNHGRVVNGGLLGKRRSMGMNEEETPPKQQKQTRYHRQSVPIMTASQKNLKIRESGGSISNSATSIWTMISDTIFGW
ncbi:hypothetical protein HK098_003351 [Nowakowskiella sp. JEL0407]|nr:hypothetical protein HK098_003351 [Nowakowskiella sp. JEL0407]